MLIEYSPILFSGETVIIVYWVLQEYPRTSSVRVCWQCLDLSKRRNHVEVDICPHLLILALGSGYYPGDFGCLVQRNCGSQGGH